LLTTYIKALPKLVDDNNCLHTTFLQTGTTTGRISHTGDGAVTQKTFFPKKMAKDFRLEFDYTYGNSTNNVKIKSVIIDGHTL